MVVESFPIDNSLAIKIISQIPSHHEDAKGIAEMADSLRIERGKDYTECIKIVISFMSLFDCIICSDGKYRMSSQIPNYYRKSIVEYLSNNRKIMTNWDREGTARDIGVVNLLERAPYFLKAIEERRVQLSSAEGETASPTRIQPCCVGVIKASIGGFDQYLHQWDQQSEQFQLIGGKCRPGEEPRTTIVREIHEELSQHDLALNRDFKIEMITGTPLREMAISRTYGAYTSYDFYVFSVEMLIDELTLSISDRWVDIAEIRRGETSDGKRIARLPQLLDRHLPGGIEAIPASMKLSKKMLIQDYVDLRPGIFGMRFNLNKLIFRRR